MPSRLRGGARLRRVSTAEIPEEQVAIIDDRKLKVVARVGDIRSPDGIAYAPEADKVFVSDESGGADIVIDPNTSRKRSTIGLDGEAGNTHYDSVSHCILVAVQTKNQLVAIDPVSERIVQRYDLPRSANPHGFTLDEPGRLAFITSEGNSLLQVVDLRTMKILQTLKVPDDPDVLVSFAVHIYRSHIAIGARDHRAYARSDVRGDGLRSPASSASLSSRHSPGARPSTVRPA